MAYLEEDFLSLSGIQHFAFCRRQWALIHIEQQWHENWRTTDGAIFHEKAHDAFTMEKRGNVIISRGMPVRSHTLGVSGVCDVVEFHLSPNGIPLYGREGLYAPIVVEYKRGKPKESDADKLQLCGQAMCLEEMLMCEIKESYLYYGEVKRRTAVTLDEALRTQVKSMLAEMHTFYSRSHTPKVKPTKACKACSLMEICLPKLERKGSVLAYIDAHLQEEPS